jgi:arabinogalactan oligomer / maltooligosaccharide transport system permease protein
VSKSMVSAGTDASIAVEATAGVKAEAGSKARAASLGARLRSGGGTALVYLFLTVMTIFSLFPLYFVLQASLRPGQQLYSTDLQLFPTNPTLDNYLYVLDPSRSNPDTVYFWQWVGNSIYVGALATLLGLIFATMGAYAFSRFRFRGKRFGLRLLLALQAFPALLAVTAYYILFIHLSLIGSREGLALVYSAGTIAFGVWNIKGYFDTLPIELEQAALVDGATPTQAFWRVTLRLATPSIAASALFMFIGAWNEFALANYLLGGIGQSSTFPVGLYNMQRDYRTPWGQFAAASVLISIPLAVLFLYLQRFFRSGLTIGSVKG